MIIPITDIRYILFFLIIRKALAYKSGFLKSQLFLFSDDGTIKYFINKSRMNSKTKTLSVTHLGYQCTIWRPKRMGSFQCGFYSIRREIFDSIQFTLCSIKDGMYFDILSVIS